MNKIILEFFSTSMAPVKLVQQKRTTFFFGEDSWEQEMFANMKPSDMPSGSCHCFDFLYNLEGNTPFSRLDRRLDAPLRSGGAPSFRRLAIADLAAVTSQLCGHFLGRTPKLRKWTCLELARTSRII